MAHAQDTDLPGGVIDRIEHDEGITHDRQLTNAGHLALPGAVGKIGKAIDRLLDGSHHAIGGGRDVRALHDDRGIAYELIVAGEKLIDYEAFATERRETLAGIPLYGAGIAVLGALMVLTGLYLFGGPPAAATPHIPTRRRATGGGFGQR